MTLEDKDTIQLQLDKGFKDCLEDLRVRLGSDFNIGSFSNQQIIKRLLWQSLQRHGYDFEWGKTGFKLDESVYKRLINGGKQ